MEGPVDPLGHSVRLAIDECILCPPDSLVLIGWILARPGALGTVRLVSGPKSTPLKFEDCIRVDRPDVIDKVAAPQGFTDSAPGFICFLPQAVTPGARNSIEIVLQSGETSCTDLPPPKLHGLPAIKRILGAFEAELPGLDLAFDTVAGPSISLLNRHRLSFPPGLTELQFGAIRGDPDYTLIVPLYGRLDYLEYQLALLSVHQPLKHQEVLLVLDDPSLRKPLLRMGESLYERFNVPFRILAVDQNLGFGPASNLGLSRARGRYSCFLNSDVFPGTPDWMEKLIGQLEGNPPLGAIGPLLLFEDGSVQHQGMDFQPHPQFEHWTFPRHSRKGMRPPENGGLRTCDAITGACMVFETNFIRNLGGFDRDYIIGDFEDSDLCLRIRRAGRDCAIDLDVWLYHMERKSQADSAQRWRRNLTLYNAWIHQHRWNGMVVDRLPRAEVHSANAMPSMEPKAGRPKPTATEAVNRGGSLHFRQDGKIRVLIASHSHPNAVNGGAERAAFELFAGLQRSGCAETWFLGCEHNDESRHSGRVLGQPCSEREFVYFTADFDWFHFANRDPTFAREFRDLLRTLRPDVVHFHHYAQLGVEALHHVRSTVPKAQLVLTLHEYLAICHHQGQMVLTENGKLCWKSGLDRCHRCFPSFSRSDFLLRNLYIHRFFDLVDRFIAPSKFLAERYIGWGIPAERVTVMENPVREAMPTKSGSRGWGAEILRVGFFGQISVLKGIEVLMEAAAILDRERERRIIFEIFGDYRNQHAEVREKFLNLVGASAGNVHYHGPYENDRIDDLMQSIDVVVVPSVWWENSPVVIQEALRNRRPVICSDIGGMAEKVRDGLDGFHFPVGSPIGLAELLKRLLSDPNELSRLQATLAVPGTTQAIVTQHLQIYNELLGIAAV